MSKILEYASDYLQRGWLPLPIPHRSKNPNLKGWQNLILSASDLPRYFNGKPQNIGVLLGSKSNGLTDIDLDSSEAVKIADFFLPETQAGFGRVSKPRSHRLYYCDESFYEKFNNPFLLASEDEEIRKTACIAEIRGKDGLQTVFPGSTHETGEPIEWHNDGEPTRIEAKELCRAVALLASAALVSTFWRNGIHNQLTLSLCGALLRNGFNISDAKNFIRAVCAVSNDEETSDRLKAVDATAQKLKSSENVFGFPKLAELTDQKLVKTVCKWLQIESRNQTDFEQDRGLRDELLQPLPTKIGLTFGELLKLEMPKREEIIRGLAKCENGLMNAVTNVGKTTLIRNVALSLVCGKPFPPITDGGRNRRVVIIDSEDTLVYLRSDINKMIANYSDADKQLVRENLLLICDVSFSDEELRINKQEHFDLLVSTICNFKANIVFIDTISRSFVIHNENDNSEVKERVMKPLKRLAKLTDTGVLASHHIGKAKLEEGAARENSHRGRGASAFADQSRVIFNLERDATDDVILSCPKLKGEKFADTIFRYDSQKRWFVKQGESKILNNYEILLELFDEKTLKRSEIGEMLEGEMSKQTITRQLSIAVKHGDLIRNKGYYSKNARLLTQYSGEQMSISSNSSNDNSLQDTQKTLKSDDEHNTDAGGVEYF